MIEPEHLSTVSYLNFTDFTLPNSLQYGMQVRNLTALQMLDLLRKQLAGTPASSQTTKVPGKGKKAGTQKPMIRSNLRMRVLRQLNFSRGGSDCNRCGVIGLEQVLSGPAGPCLRATRSRAVKVKEAPVESGWVEAVCFRQARTAPTASRVPARQGRGLEGLHQRRDRVGRERGQVGHIQTFPCGHGPRSAGR